jgi:hypothetical protein
VIHNSLCRKIKKIIGRTIKITFFRNITSKLLVHKLKIILPNMVQNKDIDYYTNPIVLIAFLQDNDVTTDIDKSIYSRRNKTFQVSYIYKGHYL